MLLTLTGESQPFNGKAEVEIMLGSHTFKHEVLLADIQQDGILGIDFLKKCKCDPIISKGCLNVKCEKVSCYMKSDEKKTVCCRIALTENVVILPESEIVVNGRPIDLYDKDTVGLTEPFSKFVEKTGLLVAKILV
ncbi:hypothetical protein ACJMK2_013176 [Sinanodonta woodiana]|uniref:Uncharacterized protein n=1 Tax=Sinanodonta woodiana TaxID=1069815 RepID=A0ABD3UWN0_SINWO